jgi:catechol 2,3-dioxygenase-like lactoylglutathione lyase family enzyme
MPILGSDPVLTVHDLERSAAWYSDVLGCQVGEVDPGNWTFCHAGGVTFMLGRCPDVPAAIETRRPQLYRVSPSRRRRCHYRKAVAVRSEVLKDLREEPRGMREFGLRSPDGHRFMVGQRVSA